MNIEKTYGDYFKIIKNQDGYRIIDLQEQFKNYCVAKIIGDKKISEKHYETLVEAENMIFTLYQKYIDVQRKRFDNMLEERDKAICSLNKENVFFYKKIDELDSSFFFRKCYGVGEFDEAKNKKHVAKEKPVKEEFVFVGETVNEKLVNELKHISLSLGVIIFLFVLFSIMLWFGGLNRL